MAAALSAQLQERMVKVNVVPDHVDWKYELGEKVKFNVVVTKNRVPQENVTVWYEVAQDMMHPMSAHHCLGKWCADIGCRNHENSWLFALSCLDKI